MASANSLRLLPHQHNCRGFSLIEVMVVLVILGLTVVFVTLGFQRLESDRLETQAGQLSAWLQALSDDAVLDSAVYGVWRSGDQKNLEVGFFLDNHWWPVNKTAMGSAAIEENTSLVIGQGDKWQPLIGQDSQNRRPDILFLPTGMALPERFQLRDDGRTATIARNADGIFEWSLQ